MWELSIVGLYPVAILVASREVGVMACPYPDARTYPYPDARTYPYPDARTYPYPDPGQS